MAGIYVHIPFCKSRCSYCAFFSTTLLPLRAPYIDALIQEYHLRHTYIPPSDPIRTIYLGGGTPSLLQHDDLARLLHSLPTNQAEEITIEANPSDITTHALHSWHNLGINRLSIGVQSFNDTLLHLLNRRHNHAQALQAIQLAQQAGFTNISIDLMYALPRQTMDIWQNDIHTALHTGVQHISTYCLSYEPHTPLWLQREQGLIHEADDDTANEMYDYLCHTLSQAGFEHYEVSNFALPNYHSKHNSSYWNNTSYLGLGAGAHSFNQSSRQWNIDDLHTYIHAITQGQLPFEKEWLSPTDIFNEHVMLALRTNKGIEATPELLQKAQPYLQTHLLEHSNGHIHATLQGIHILNTIITDLMRDDDN